MEGRPGSPRDTFTGTQPSAGEEVEVTVPAGEDWDFLGAIITLDTNSTVAVRSIDILMEDESANEIARWVSNTTISLNQVVAVHIGNYPDALPVDTSTDHYHPIGRNIEELGPGYKLRTVTNNIQSGDQYSAPIIYRKRWKA